MGYGDFKKAARRVARNARGRDDLLKQEAFFTVKEKERKVKKLADRAAMSDRKLELSEDICVTEEYLDVISHNHLFNDIYCDYYRQLFSETNRQAIRSASERIILCHEFWNGDMFRFQRVYDVKRVQLCHDKFCVICQHLKQAKRMMIFTPLVDALREKYDLYHLVLTVPNVKGKYLTGILDRMSVSFKKIIRYFSGDAKIKGVDFAQYGYAGAVRCFEIVSNPFDDYHPHLHCLLILKKDLGLHKYIIHPSYSYNHGIFSGRKFSDFEILIQKIWWLLVNGNKVQLDKIDVVPEGYSCTLDLTEDKEWHEVFKYVTKLTKDGAPCLEYEQFKTLFFALYRRRIFQGYGCLYNLPDMDNPDVELAAAEYEKKLAQLRLVEDPDEGVSFTLNKLSENIRLQNITAISKKLILKKYLKELFEEGNTV